MLPYHKVAIGILQYAYTHTLELGKTQYKSTLIIVLQMGRINISSQYIIGYLNIQQVIYFRLYHYSH